MVTLESEYRSDQLRHNDDQVCRVAAHSRGDYQRQQHQQRENEQPARSTSTDSITTVPSSSSSTSLNSLPSMPPSLRDCDGGHDMLPWWFGNEESEHIRHVLAQFHALLMIDSNDRRPLHSLRPARFIGRIKRQFPRFRWVEDNEGGRKKCTQTFETIDEISIYERGTVPDWRPILPLKQKKWTRTRWNIADGTVISTKEIDDNDDDHFCIALRNMSISQQFGSQCSFEFGDSDSEGEDLSSHNNNDGNNSSVLDCHCDFYLYAMPTINKISNPRRLSPRNSPKANKTFSETFVDEGDEFVFFTSTERLMVGYASRSPLEYQCVQRCFYTSTESKMLDLHYDSDDDDDHDDHSFEDHDAYDSGSQGMLADARPARIQRRGSRCRRLDSAPDHLRNLLAAPEENSSLLTANNVAGFQNGYGTGCEDGGDVANEEEDDDSEDVSSDDACSDDDDEEEEEDEEDSSDDEETYLPRWRRSARR